MHLSHRKSKFGGSVTLSLLASLLLCSNSSALAETLNDIHSQLNPTNVLELHAPTSEAHIRALILEAKRRDLAISLSGGRHSMGGQQFGAGNLHLDLSGFNQVQGFNPVEGWIEVQAGIQWPEVIAWLQKNQPMWTIRQKQTGADRLSIGGALSSNIHGRGLKMKPFIDDVESFELINADGESFTCSRHENSELFRLVIGGYGLFGVITKVKLRLTHLTTLERVVELINVDDYIPLVTKRIDEGFVYGDFQFSIDPQSDDFLKKGVYSLYRTVPIAPASGASSGAPSGASSGAEAQKELSESDWVDLLGLAHTDKAQAFQKYSSYYLSTNGQLYRSDTHQLGVYVDNYHQRFGGHAASEMISEIYVPRSKLPALFEKLRSDFRKYNVDVIYGTVRLIEPDRESFLAWAKEDYAATVFNFHVEHSPEGIEKAKRDFTRIIDRALEFGGNYYLTYHRWARRDQVLKAYPQMPKFLELKKKYDPAERFQSEWYRGMVELLSHP